MLPTHDQKIHHWLAFLASQMRIHLLTACSIEQIQPDWLPHKAKWRYRWSVAFIFGIFPGLLSGLFLGLLAGPFVGFLTADLVTLLMTLFFGLITNRVEKILFPGYIQWSWKRLIQGIILGACLGLILGLLFGPITGVSGLPTWLVNGTLLGLVSGLFRGFVTHNDPDRATSFPKTILWHALIKGGMQGLISGLLIGGSMGKYIGLTDGLAAGLLIGLLVGLFQGLGALLRHITLRFWLWQSGSLPFFLVSFLEEACKQQLLTRIGDTYQFIDPMQLDHFANLESHHTVPFHAQELFNPVLQNQELYDQ